MSVRVRVRVLRRVSTLWRIYPFSPKFHCQIRQALRLWWKLIRFTFSTRLVVVAKCHVPTAPGSKAPPRKTVRSWRLWWVVCRRMVSRNKTGGRYMMWARPNMIIIHQPKFVPPFLESIFLPLATFRHEVCCFGREIICPEHCQDPTGEAQVPRISNRDRM